MRYLFILLLAGCNATFNPNWASDPQAIMGMQLLLNAQPQPRQMITCTTWQNITSCS